MLIIVDLRKYELYLAYHIALLTLEFIILKKDNFFTRVGADWAVYGFRPKNLLYK